VDHKNNVRVFEISFDFQPLAVTQRRAEVVRSHTQPELVHTIDLSLRVLERRDAAERLFQQQPGRVAGGLTWTDVRTVEPRHQLKAREDQDRQLGGAVAEIDAGRVEEERRSAPDAGAARQELAAPRP